MRAVIQRVSESSVKIDDSIKSKTGVGLLVFLGIGHEDGPEDIEWLSGKISQLRIFDDDEGVMNNSVLDIDGDVMVISQFTLHAKVKKGTRPSFMRAAKPEVAIPLYKQFVKAMVKELGKPVATGEFGADMQVSLVNDGPVTIVIDTKNKE